MSVTTSFYELPPASAAYLSIPIGTQAPAEIDAIYQSINETTKHGGYNLTPREVYGISAANYPMDQVFMSSNGLSCQNTNMLGGRPNKNPAQYHGSCSSPRYPEQNAGLLNAELVYARQGADRYIDKIGMFNYSMGNVDVSTTLLGAPPQSVQMNAAKGSTLNRDGASYTSFTGLQGLNYPPALNVNFYSPLPQSSMTVGSCTSSQYNSNVSFCNNGQ
jgi:hypothetical protein